MKLCEKCEEVRREELLKRLRERVPTTQTLMWCNVPLHTLKAEDLLRIIGDHIEHRSTWGVDLRDPLANGDVAKAKEERKGDS